MAMPKTINRAKKKNWSKFWSDNKFVNWRILNYFNQVFKIHISLLTAKTELKQQSLNQMKHCLTGYIQIWLHFFQLKNIKVFQWFQNPNFLVLWLKWTQTKETEQNQRFFYWLQNTKIFQWLL